MKYHISPLLLFLTLMAAPVKAQDTTAVVRDQQIIAEIKRAEDGLREQGIPLLIQRVSFLPNSDGAMEPRIEIKSLSPKSMKSVTVALVGFDSGGERTKTVLGSSMLTLHLNLVKPLVPGDDATFLFSHDSAWYVSTTTCVELRKVTIEFTDGSSWVGVKDLDAARMGNPIKLEGECGVN